MKQETISIAPYPFLISLSIKLQTRLTKFIPHKILVTVSPKNCGIFYAREISLLKTRGFRITKINDSWTSVDMALYVFVLKIIQNWSLIFIKFLKTYRIDNRKVNVRISGKFIKFVQSEHQLWKSTNVLRSQFCSCHNWRVRSLNSLFVNFHVSSFN